ncbi:hypothetical protein FB382_004285 [Nocardioides ginsengisegetis]|uniref:Sucrase/ferredoxin-like n=1 Tax=Nocardioides ginsengisegetis TaxID=661491 RepID=A0A7W3J4B3_9ACTN|nr:hypothetical protein [Nocardioides ginsengisegetis]
MTPETYRCSAASALDAEPMAGTAPEDTAWLLVEYAGSWGRNAVADSRLPDGVREVLEGAVGVRVQLIRRHGGWAGPGVHVFAARLGATGRVWGTVLERVDQVTDLDLGALARGGDPGLPAHEGPLWLLCTNGRRDRCCAEIGRPVAAALAERWPAATWETTHLGGHRFSGTLLALPSGVTLGRLDPDTAVEACAEIAAGGFPTANARGRAGLPAAAQVAELHVRTALGLDGLHDLDDVSVGLGTGETVSLTVAGREHRLTVASTPGEPRRQSCADLKLKGAPVHTVTGWDRP